MTTCDQSQGFLFESTNIRGGFVGLDSCWQTIQSKHAYPEPVAQLLGQLVAASALLSKMHHFDGAVILQVHGSEQVKQVFVECSSQESVRGMAIYEKSFSPDKVLLGNGRLAITLEPRQGQRYQSVVELVDGDSLAGVLERYFLQSEQIQTRIWLSVDQQRASGMMLQVLPEDDTNTSFESIDPDLWNRVGILADSVTGEELRAVSNETLLTRLFYDEVVGIFEPTSVQFECSCSRERSENAVVQLGEADALALVEERGCISSSCQFCLENYTFTKEDVLAIFASFRDSFDA